MATEDLATPICTLRISLYLSISLSLLPESRSERTHEEQSHGGDTKPHPDRGWVGGHERVWQGRAIHLQAKVHAAQLINLFK